MAIFNVAVFGALSSPLRVKVVKMSSFAASVALLLHVALKSSHRVLFVDNGGLCRGGVGRLFSYH